MPRMVQNNLLYAKNILKLRNLFESLVGNHLSLKVKTELQRW
jgi:hypothetical protein